LAETFDLVVVGAGSAGCVLAARLSQDPAVRVLLLEAGGGDRHPMISAPLAWTTAQFMDRFNWGYVTEPEPGADGRVLPQPRGRMLGGTSSINGMMYTRGHAADYDSWAAMGLAGWSYAEVLPYFRRSETSWRGAGPYHGGAGPLSVVANPPDPFLTPRMLQAAQRMGYHATDDFNGAQQAGFSLPDFTISHGRRHSTSRAFLDPARSRPNLTVRTGALTTRVLIENGRAAGVEYLRDGRTQTVRAGEVIVAGGAFASPQILMLSGVGPADQLRAVGIEPLVAVPGVGRNLQDHPLMPAVYEAAGPYCFHEDLRLDRLARIGLQWALSGAGPLGRMPMGIQGFLTLGPDEPRPDTQFQVSAVSMAARPWFPGWRSSAGHHFTAAALQLRPQGRGDVGLRSADPRDHPRIRLGLFQHEVDRQAAREMVRFMREFFATEPLASLVRQELLPGAAAQSQDEVDAVIRSVIQTGMHPAGTCAMGVDDQAVVDAELKVRGVAGLRVVDASVMPNVVSGNTNAPAIMIAEKASDMILGRAPEPPQSLPPVARKAIPA